MPHCEYNTHTHTHHILLRMAYHEIIDECGGEASKQPLLWLYCGAATATGVVGPPLV